MHRESQVVEQVLRSLRGLVRYHVLIVIDLATRRVEIGGITCDPTGAWMMQAARNPLDAEDGFLLGKTHLIMDRDPVFTKDVREFLSVAGVEPVRLPARSPKRTTAVVFQPCWQNYRLGNEDARRSPQFTPLRSDSFCPSKASA